jgi:hypothetical protein
VAEKQDDIRLLSSIPALEGLIRCAPSTAGLRTLNLQQRRRVIEILLDEFVRRGLDENDEPNAVGLHLERIIDELSGDDTWSE